MSNIAKIWGVLVMLALIGVSWGEEGDSMESYDAASPILVMSANSTEVTITNVGTAPADIGASIVRDDNGSIVAALPYSCVLVPNPYEIDELKERTPGVWKVTRKLTGNVSPGDTLRLFRNVGVLATTKVVA